MEQRTQQKLEDLNVMNDFLFNAIATDSDIAEPFFSKLLSILLEKEIGDIHVSAQAFLPGNSPELRSICMDVEIREDDNSPAQCKIYNIEAQDYKEKFLQKRGRFYQARKDSKGLKRGDKSWNKLPDLYVIFITTYDPFGKDYMIYTFENTCRLHPEIDYNDGLKFIYFNTVGTKGGTKSIFQLLQYLNCSKIELVTNPHIAQLHSYVSDLKREAEVKNRYMTWGEYGERVVQEILEIRQEELKIREEEFAIRENELKIRDEELKSRDEELKSRDEELKSREKNIETYVRTKANRSLLEYIISNKFGIIPDNLSAVLQAASEEMLNNWIVLASAANTIDDFIKQVK